MDRDSEGAVSAASVARAARLFSQRPEFLGYWLALYVEVEQLDTTGVARLLGCEPEILNELALCLRPREEQLFADIAEIGERWCFDEDALADLLRDASVYEVSRRTRTEPGASEAPSSAPAWAAFAAACDREAGMEQAVDESAGAPPPDSADRDDGD
jgi:hypothetical protein